MNGAQRRHCAAVLLVVASVFWWHRWVPALLLAGIAFWAILHRRLEGDLGRDLGRLWRRFWPPSSMVLVPVLVGGTIGYWVADGPVTPKLLPIALNIVALSVLLFGNWWRMMFARPSARSDGEEGGRVRSVIVGLARPLHPSVDAAASASKVSGAHT